jgi:hypothetical protein
MAREARSLAAIAAADKGLELSPESLDRYARIISGQPFFSEPVDPDGGNAGQGGGNPGSGGNPQGENRQGGNPGDGKGKRDEPGINGEALKKLALEEEAKDPLLGFLNHAPGKDGKRWLTFPFPVQNGLYATLRILLSPGARIPGGVEQMALEINGGSRRWLFTFSGEAFSEVPASPSRPILRVAVWSMGEEECAGLKGELAEHLGLAPELIEVFGGNEPVFAPDCQNNSLFSVSEEV